jgi:hypothetical protein
MFHPEDYEMFGFPHSLTIDVVQNEIVDCKKIIMALYNDGTITEDDVALRLKEIKRLTKIISVHICELHNIVDRSRDDLNEE